MRVWLVKAGEPLPSDEGAVRLHRVGTLAGLLAEHGHAVTWWTSSFDHYLKRQRSDGDARVALPNGLQVIMLRGCGYRRNVSLARIREHRKVARAFSRAASAEPRPDVVLCAYPTLEFAVAATRYGKAMHVPVVVDIRDLWPDLILELAPSWARPLAHLALTSMRSQARESCRGATAICGTSPYFVEWGLQMAGRARSPLDRDFPLGYAATRPHQSDLESAEDFWRALDIREGSGVFTACFFGSMSRQFDLSTVVEAARILETRGAGVRFVLCGAGKQSESLRRRAAGLHSVTMPGWVQAAHIWVLMRRSQVGLAPYLQGAGFAHNYPNKTIEYLSAGLPVLSSLGGEFQKLLASRGCGVSYRARDPVALANVLASLAAQPNALRGMARRAQALFKERFDARLVYRGMMDYLAEVAATGRPEGGPAPA